MKRVGLSVLLVVWRSMRAIMARPSFSLKRKGLSLLWVVRVSFTNVLLVVPSCERNECGDDGWNTKSTNVQSFVDPLRAAVCGSC